MLLLQLVVTRDETEVRHPIFARMYARMSGKAEAKGQADHREEVLRGLSGRVVEVGAGNGLNFAHYPASVEEVVAVEPEEHLRKLARESAQTASVRVNVVDGVAGRLPLDDESCDAGMASLVLCTVPDQEAALAELHRVIRPGGELRFYEHVVANNRGLARFQRFADATFWPRLGGGCHLSRDTGAAIERAGFIVESSRRFPFTRPVPGGAGGTARACLGAS
jgi:ubiquinone/menaquinone biosynthesis C-methylase UbiE